MVLVFHCSKNILKFFFLSHGINLKSWSCIISKILNLWGWVKRKARGFLSASNFKNLIFTFISQSSPIVEKFIFSKKKTFLLLLTLSFLRKLTSLHCYISLILQLFPGQFRQRHTGHHCLSHVFTRIWVDFLDKLNSLVQLLVTVNEDVLAALVAEYCPGFSVYEYTMQLRSNKSKFKY